MDGIIIVDKPCFLTSHDVVSRLRHILNIRKTGHAGTLDPLATGVLVVGVGKGCKLLRFLEADDKTYRVTMRLGYATTTGDGSGDLTVRRPYQRDISPQQLQAVLDSFIGTIPQKVPQYSAVKVHGRPLYKYARQHIDVETPVRMVDIMAISLLAFQDDLITLEVTCGKGTYIRALCEDIAAGLGYPGMVVELRRLASGSFTLEMAQSLEKIAQGDFTYIGMNEALPEMEKLVIADPAPVYNGQMIAGNADGYRAVYDQDGNLLAVYEPAGENMLRCTRGLW